MAAKQQAEILRKQLAAYTSIKGIGRCGGVFQAVKVLSDGRHPIEVTYYCDNKHVCPTCMRYIYARHQREFERTLDWWEEARGSVYTQTFSLPNRNKPLKYKHEDLARTWQAVGKSKGYQSLRKTYGVTQYLRVLEDSLKVIGSNPHFHLTWFFNSHYEENHMQAFANKFALLWEGRGEAVGARGVQANQQWSGPIRDSNQAYARYMFKHGYWDLSFDAEQAIGNNQGLKPLEFLRVMLATGNEVLLKVWHEYEDATFKRHRIQPSRDFLWAPLAPRERSEPYDTKNKN